MSNLLRSSSFLLRSDHILLRAAHRVKSRGVRSVGLLAHFATPHIDDAAPHAAIRTGRHPANRRKCSSGAWPGAHCAQPVVRTLVGKRSDAHFISRFVRMCAI